MNTAITPGAFGKPAPAAGGAPWLALAIVLGVLGAFALNAGYLFPALSLNLKTLGFSAATIGAQSAAGGVGVMVAGLAAPVLAARFGSWGLALGALIVSSAAVAGFGLIEPIGPWFALRFITGFSASLLFILSETWLNQLAPDHMRGRIVSIYTSMNAGLFGLGPGLIPLIGYAGLTPYVLVALATFALGLPMIWLRNRVPAKEPAAQGGILVVWKLIPVLLFAVAVFGFFDGAVLGLWAVYSLDHGISEDRAALLLMAMIVGNVVLQPLIGWLADRMSRKLLLIICAFAGCFGAALLPVFDLASNWTVPYLMIWGALSFGAYTVALTIIGERLKGSQLVAANGAFGIMWGVGTLVGAGVTGVIMTAVGSIGLPLALSAMFAVLCVLALTVRLVRETR